MKEYKEGIKDRNKDRKNRKKENGIYFNVCGVNVLLLRSNFILRFLLSVSAGDDFVV